MSDHPANEELLLLVESLPPGDQRRMLWHLLSCPRCGRLAQDLLTQGDGDTSLLAFDLDAIYRRVAASLEHLWPPSDPSEEGGRESGDRAAEAALVDLLAMPRSQRLDRLRQGTVVATWELAALALDQATGALDTDPTAAGELATLALATASCLAPGRWSERLRGDLQLRGWALAGESLRRLDDLGGAAAALERGARHLEVSIDPAAEALYLHLLGLLRRSQGRPATSRRLLAQAAEDYLGVGEQDKAARPLHSLGLLDLLAGGARAAVTRFESALAWAHGEGSTAAVLRHHLAVAQGELGRFPAARETVNRGTAAPELPESAWLLGRVWARTGRAPEAVDHLRLARQAFFATERPCAAALAALDLAWTLFALERRSALAELAAEVGTEPAVVASPVQATVAELLRRLVDGAAGAVELDAALEAVAVHRRRELVLPEPV